ncbi:hypothetical protein JOD78_004363 [Herbaspirillum sp. 1130]|nr:hypothetical protein [Herbaspirillum sp. 1130]
MTPKQTKYVHPNLHAAAQAYAKRRSDELQKKWEITRDLMDREIGENGGLYPYNKGVLTLTEICRRAKFSIQALYVKSGSGPRPLFSEIMIWLESKRGKRNDDIQSSERIDSSAFWKSKFEKIANSICITELDLRESYRLNRELTTELAKVVQETNALKVENEALLRELAQLRRKINPSKKVSGIRSGTAR